jgi:DNA-directed RNA polymerase specialized sigma24 family protein
LPIRKRRVTGQTAPAFSIPNPIMADGGGFDMAACLASVRDGDEAAARGLVEELWPLVIKIVRSHLPRRTAEEDLAQEIFLKIFSRLAQYQARDGKPFAHWVSRVAVTTCLDASSGMAIRRSGRAGGHVA